MTTAADAIVEALAEAGVEKVFGVIGTSTLDLVDAMTRDPRLEFVSAREEEAAAHMADGYARASGRVGVVMCHVGPGALRQMYGVGTAWKDSVPLLALTGNEVMHATDHELREGYHVIDVLTLYGPITKATLQLRRPEDARALVGRALWTAGSGRPGPVLLDLPKSSLKQPFDPAAATATGPLSDTVPRARPAPCARDVTIAATALAGARHPVVLAGGGVRWAGAHDALLALAHHRNLAVLTTDGGRGAVPEDDPLCLGVVARQAGDHVARSLLAEADVVLAVGTPFSDVSTFEWSAWSDDATVVQVDITADGAHKGSPADHVVVADAREFLVALDDDLERRDHRHGASWADRRDALDRERAGHLRSADEGARTHGVNPWVLIEELAISMARDTFVSVDSGMHAFYGRKLPVLDGRAYVRSAGFGAMGYAFPALLGAVEGQPDRRGVAVVGDGCLAMCLGEFETAARRGSPVTVVVCNDSRFASQQSHQHRRFEGRVAGTDFLPTDFVAIAQAQGVPGWQVTTDADARTAVRAALAMGGPSVIDARLDPAVQPTTWIEGSGDPRIAAET